MAELARRLRVSRDWLERRIRNGTIAIAHDAASGRLLFPDTDVTLAHFQELKAGSARSPRLPAVNSPMRAST
jgi:hypothetical protein